jgi:hypothetical protein
MSSLFVRQPFCEQMLDVRHTARRWGRRGIWTGGGAGVCGLPRDPSDIQVEISGDVRTKKRNGRNPLPANECPPISPALFHPPAAVCPSMHAPSRTPDFSSSVMLSPHVGSDAKDGEFVSALRPKIACMGAGTPLHCGISVPSMSESGQSRHTRSGPAVVCPLHPQKLT